jgi:DNA-binding response OmpR family regulator
MRLLVVEDERKVADALSEGLSAEQYDVVVERTGESAYFRLMTEAFDLVLLDLGLPDRGGLDVLTALPIDVHIARLRRKIERPDAVRLIHTIRGVGFMLRYGEP